MPVVRLERRQIVLADGHEVGVAAAGTGMPLVMAHGFAAQGVLYAQTLTRLVSMGFKVIAIDIAGHGGTRLPPLPATDLAQYVRILAEAIDTLGVRHAVLMGHSMGGRLVAEVAAQRPELAVALVLVDPIVGPSWDHYIRRLRRDPLAVARLSYRLVADTAAVIDVSDLSHAARLLMLLVRAGGLPVRPERLGPPAVALVLAPPSAPSLEAVAAHGVPAVVIHGDRDRPIPIGWAREAAGILKASFVAVHGAGHSWLLRDPEALPGIFGALLKGPIGDAWSAGLLGAGLDPAFATLDEIEEAMTSANALVGHVAQRLEFPGSQARSAAHFAWTIEDESGNRMSR